MKNFKTAIVNSDSKKKYNFECYENTELINIGDRFIFFFGDIVDVQECFSEQEKYEINPNDKIRDGKIIDFVTGFWKHCYKIKSTDFDIDNYLNS